MHEAEEAVWDFLKRVEMPISTQPRTVSVYDGQVFTLGPLPAWVLEDWPEDS